MGPSDLAWIVAAYFVGSLPFGVLIGRLKGVDPREVGSKNIGATNVMRALGTGPGLLVLGLDMGKGYLLVWLAMRHYTTVVATTPPHFQLVGPGWWVVFFTAVAAMVGHIFPIFLGFRGGKGVATVGGIILALDPRVGVFAVLSFLVTLGATRYVSVSSTLAALAIPLAGLFLATRLRADTVSYRPDIVACFGGLAALFVIYKHRANYKRLAHGQEPKFGEKVTPIDAR